MTSQDKAAELSRKHDAVAGLYETHFERVARYITVRIGDIAQAEDLASEVFLRALRSVESFKETGVPMEAWIFKIAHNIVVDYLRSKARKPAFVSLDDAGQIAGQHNPVENAERMEEIQALHRAMEQLTDAQRQVVSLRFGADMTAEQVAEVMGKKPGAVREMQSAAIKKLRQVLDKTE